MENTTISPPLCSKHGCEKVWRKDRNSKNGGRWVCKKCASAASRAWAKANPEKVRAHERAWREANRERKQAADRAWFLANRERKQATGRAWFFANRERRQATDRAWREANREKFNNRKRIENQERRAIHNNATSPLCAVTAAAIAERFALTDGCAYCGAEEKLTLDHVVPLNDGGLHVPSNLVGACGCCNSSKNASPVEEWYRKQPFFSEQRWQRIQQITGDGQLSLI